MFKFFIVFIQVMIFFISASLAQESQIQKGSKNQDESTQEILNVSENKNLTESTQEILNGSENKKLTESVQEISKSEKHEEATKEDDKPYWYKIHFMNLHTAEWIALAENPSLAAVKKRIFQAQERMKQAKSSYWPRIDIRLTASHVDLSKNDYDTALASARLFNPFADVDDPDHVYSPQLTVSWTLFDGFERRHSYKTAYYGALVNDQYYRNSRRLLLSSVAASYFQAQLARENLAIAESDEKFYQKQADEAKARLDVGTGSLSDKLNFDVRVNSAKTDLIKAKQQYDSSMYALAAMLGIPDAVFPSHTKLASLDPETESEMEMVEVEKKIEYAKKHRSDIKSYEYQLKQAESQVKLAKSGFYPKIDVNGAYTGESKGDSRFDSDDFGNTASINLSYNIFAGGYNKAKLIEAKHKKAESEKNYQNVCINIISEVRNAVTQLDSSQKQLKLQRSNANLVQQNRDLVEKEYSAGRASLMRLNEAQRDLTNAKGRLALALVSLRLAWHNLKASTGEIVEPFNQQK